MSTRSSAAQSMASSSRYTQVGYKKPRVTAQSMGHGFDSTSVPPVPCPPAGSGAPSRVTSSMTDDSDSPVPAASAIAPTSTAAIASVPASPPHTGPHSLPTVVPVVDNAMGDHTAEPPTVPASAPVGAPDVHAQAVVTLTSPNATPPGPVSASAEATSTATGTPSGTSYCASCMAGHPAQSTLDNLEKALVPELVQQGLIQQAAEVCARQCRVEGKLNKLARVHPTLWKENSPPPLLAFSAPEPTVRRQTTGNAGSTEAADAVVADGEVDYASRVAAYACASSMITAAPPRRPVPPVTLLGVDLGERNLSAAVRLKHADSIVTQLTGTMAVYEPGEMVSYTISNDQYHRRIGSRHAIWRGRQRARLIEPHVRAKDVTDIRSGSGACDLNHWIHHLEARQVHDPFIWLHKLSAWEAKERIRRAAASRSVLDSFHQQWIDDAPTSPEQTVSDAVTVAVQTPPPSASATSDAPAPTTPDTAANPPQPPDGDPPPIPSSSGQQHPPGAPTTTRCGRCGQVPSAAPTGPPRPPAVPVQPKGPATRPAKRIKQTQLCHRLFVGFGDVRGLQSTRKHRRFAAAWLKTKRSMKKTCGSANCKIQKEHGSTKGCYSCGGTTDLVQPRGTKFPLHGLRFCKRCCPPTNGNSIRYLGRDTNAARNILRVFVAELLGMPHPAYLRPASPTTADQPATHVPDRPLGSFGAASNAVLHGSAGAVLPAPPTEAVSGSTAVPAPPPVHTVTSEQAISTDGNPTVAASSEPAGAVVPTHSQGEHASVGLRANPLS